MMTAQDRKRQERQARRRRIQNAALPVFVERGFARASIEQIAKQAQLSVGAIYLYFQSKEDLYVSLLETSLTDLDVGLAEVRSGDPRARLAQVWARLTSWVEAEPESARALAMLSQPGLRAQLSDEVATGIAAVIGRLRDHLGAAVADGIHAGAFRSVSPAEVADLLWTAFIGSLAHDGVAANLELSTAQRATLFACVEAGLRAAEAAFVRQAA
ncbi:MAG TPA: TetR/AcrR family transcriptional regulator [Kofleriaceae bacterium]|nr:TetR/AcrR family transcriptional regulator [Kofleriaceae bacterium]